MNLFYSESEDEFARIKLTLGSGLTRVSTTSELKTALERFVDSRTVILAPSVNEAKAFAIAEDLRITHPNTKIILMRNRIDVPLLSSAMHAGISNVVAAQDATALVNAVKTFEDVEMKRSALNQNGPNLRAQGKVVFVYSAKGGCGKTTISTNLAAALASRQKLRVCVVDLDLQFGDIAVSLKLVPSKSIADALAMNAKLDTNSLGQLVVSYDGLFDTLLAPTDSRTILNPNADQIERVINLLQSSYDLVIVDVSTSFNETVIRMLELCDLTLLITTLDVSAVKNLNIILKTLDEMNFSSRRRQIILNKSDQKIGLSRRDVEDLTSTRVLAEIPNSSDVSKSTNQGIPLVVNDLRHPFSKAIENLGNLAIELIELKEKEGIL